MTEKEKMLRGELYLATDCELVQERRKAEETLFELNATSVPKQRDTLLRSLLGSVGDDVEVRTPFFCDYGYNVHLGSGVFLNFNCVLLDVTPIHIGDRTQVGPGVHIYTADHPRDPELRLSGRESGKPVKVGKNVWIGGGAIVLPGVVVGDDAIIGAGAVVARTVAKGETVVGNPARPARSR